MVVAALAVAQLNSTGSGSYDRIVVVVVAVIPEATMAQLVRVVGMVVAS